MPNPVEFVALWPTPRVQSGKGACIHGTGGLDLQTAVKLWPTPSANKITTSGEIVNAGGTQWDGKSKPHSKRTGKPIQTALSDSVKLYPTPDVRGFENEGSPLMLKEKVSKEEFFGVAYRASASKKERIWGTPTANDAKNSLTGSPHGRGTLTADIVESRYPTPGTTGLSNGSGNCETINKLFRESVISDDERRSMRSANGGQLNADWVERLMGYPDGWTDIEKDDVDRRNRYPAAWRDGSWDTIPRIVVSQKNRTLRLKGLGNSILPQIAAFLWGLVLRTLWI
jgi:hypothetical protein